MMVQDTERRNTGHIVLAFACVYFLWGSAFVANRYGVQLVHPAVLAGLRYVIAGSCLLAFVIMRGQPIRIGRKDFLRVAGLGLIMFTCNTVLLGYGGRELNAGTTALVIATIPLFIALLQWTIPGGNKMSGLGWLGTVTGFLGLALLSRSGLHTSVSKAHTALGFAALLAAALAWAVGSVLAQRVTFKAASLLCISWQMLIGGSVNLIIGATLGGFHTSHFTVRSVASIAYLAIFGTLAGYTSYAYLLRNVKLTTLATYAYVNPVVAIVLGWLVLGEAIAADEWAGLLVVLLSVAIVVSAKSKPRIGSDSPTVENSSPDLTATQSSALSPLSSSGNA
ncbi:MAG: EamA family transporter [Acidobacteriota bacterium]